MDQVQTILEGTIDFQGQKQATRFLKLALSLATFASISYGLATGSATNSIISLAVIYVVIQIFALIPWPNWNKNPLKYQSIGAY